MDNNFNIDNVIRNTLQNSAKNISMEENSFQELKVRIEKENKSLKSILSERFYDYKAAVKFNTRKAVTSMLCALLIATTLGATFIPSVRATAVNAVKTYLYMPIKNAGGGFGTEAVPAENVEVKFLKITRTTMSDEEISDEIGYTVQVPEKLINKYEASEKWLVSGFKTSKNVSAAAIYIPEGTTDKAKFALSIMKGKSYEYKQTVEISSSEASQNQKKLQIGDIDVFYYESPVFKGLEELEMQGKHSEEFLRDIANEPREILTAHAMHWIQGGLGYNLTDAGNNLSIEDMKAIVEEIINGR